jgi:hypothetical protein
MATSVPTTHNLSAYTMPERIIASVAYYCGLVIFVVAATRLVLEYHGGDAPAYEVLPPNGTAIHVLAVTPGVRIEQPFYCASPHLSGLRFTVATWAKTPSDDLIQWQLVDTTDGSDQLLVEGRVSPATCRDWGLLDIRLNKHVATEDRMLKFVLIGTESPVNPVGVARYANVPDGIPPARIVCPDATASSVEGCLGLHLQFGAIAASTDQAL